MNSLLVYSKFIMVNLRAQPVGGSFVGVGSVDPQSETYEFTQSKTLDTSA